MVKEKNFREDLLYRINVIEIDIPPLRERIEDIPELCYSILKNINKRYNLNIDSISEETLKLLSSYNWPGNVRELVHALERACVVTDNPILQADDFYFISKKIVSKSEETECSNNYFYNKKFQEKNFIVDILKSCKGNKSLAAKTLGISRSLLYYKIKELNIKL